MKRINVLDIPFDAVNEFDALSAIVKFVRDGEKHKFIATPNPEMLLAARKDSDFRDLLSRTDLNIADGTGIIWAADYLDNIKNVRSRLVKILIGIKSLLVFAFTPGLSGRLLPERVTGTDMMELVCKNIGSSFSVYLLGGKNTVAEKTAETLRKKYGVKVAGTNNGPSGEEGARQIVEDINAKKPDILFVAFGAPKQELWINRHLPELETVNVAMGVGGAFDFISGNVKRAPLFMRKTGLEWLYRLIKQPSRIERIFNATVVFPICVIKSAL